MQDDGNDAPPATKDDEEAPKAPESPRPLAFTIDFGGGKVDSQKHKSLMEKYQKRHRRGQSLSKLEDTTTPPGPCASVKKHPLSGNLPRKSNYQTSEEYISSEERGDKNSKISSTNIAKLKDSFCLPLKNMSMDRMVQSCTLPRIKSPELKDFSSPELDLLSPFGQSCDKVSTAVKSTSIFIANLNQECESEFKKFDLLEDLDRADDLSDTGTYTLDADNYSEDQKARMSIDRNFKIEQISVKKKTEEYVRNLIDFQELPVPTIPFETSKTDDESVVKFDKPRTLDLKNTSPVFREINQIKPISTIVSPIQNLSIVQNNKNKQLNTEDDQQSFTKVMFPSSKSRTGIGPTEDQGSVISITSSGAFRSKNEKERRRMCQLSLTKSEIHVEAYTEESSNRNQPELVVHASLTLSKSNGSNLTANVVHVADSLSKSNNANLHNSVQTKVSNVPQTICSYPTKGSPTKIPSPVHSARPRSTSSINSLNIDLSDSSLETESYLNPTQKIIKSLQQRLSLEDDTENETKYLNNHEATRHLIKRAPNLRHNSFDDRNPKISNKLEHFQNKNLQIIDQTMGGNSLLNQYHQVKIQNSPNGSPIRRSSSFTTKNQVIISKNSNLERKQSNLYADTLNINRNASIQRSSSTASIKPGPVEFRRSSGGPEHRKIDRNQFGDTESSSEDDFEKNLKKKDITNTRYNRAFSLRRGRLDAEPVQAKCPNTPEMRRKFVGGDHRGDRSISVDRKAPKAIDVPSRYLQSIAKKGSGVVKQETPKINVPRPSSGPPKIQSQSASKVFSRTDSGRFSVRSTKPPSKGNPKSARKEHTGEFHKLGIKFFICIHVIYFVVVLAV